MQLSLKGGLLSGTHQKPRLMAAMPGNTANTTVKGSTPKTRGTAKVHCY